MRWFFALFVCVMGTAPAFASEAPKLKLGDLIELALASNPEILAARSHVDAVRARVPQVTTLPDPVVSVGYNSAGNPLPGAGLGSNPVANIGFSVSQDLPYPGKLRERGAVAKAEAGMEFHQYTRAEQVVVARVKTAYYEWQHQYEVIRLLDENRDLLERIIKIAELRYSVGGAAQQDVFRTQTQISILEAKIIQATRDMRSAEAQLASIVQTSIAGRLQPLGAHEAVLTVDLKALYDAAQKNSPSLLRDQKAIERSEAGISLARKDAYPDLSVTGGYYNMGSMPPMYSARVDLKIPIRSRRVRAEIAEQSSSLAEARRTYEADGQSILYQIQDNYLTAETAARISKLYRDTVIPQASLALDSSLASYETGKLDLQTVVGNYSTVLEYELDYHEQVHMFHRAMTQLEELTGTPLVPAQSVHVQMGGAQ